MPEEVLAKDETSGKMEKKVAAKFEGKSAVLALTFSNGERLLATADYPLYVEGQGFRAAQQCGIGTSIVTRAGPSLRVTKVEKLAGTVAVYNFSVRDSETFFIGGSGLWVHNCGQIDGDSRLGSNPDRGRTDRSWDGYDGALAAARESWRSGRGSASDVRSRNGDVDWRTKPRREKWVED